MLMSCIYTNEHIYYTELIYFSWDFLGHSNGGAVAALVFSFLLEKFKLQKEVFLKCHFKCITFGLMPFADNSLKQYVEAIPGARDCFCHIVQKNDIVPKLFGSLNMTVLQVC